MKKTLFILLLSFISLFSFAQVKVDASGNIIPTGIYPAVNSGHVKGAVHYFPTLIDRDALPANFRDTGMIAYVFEDTTYYTLKHGILNSDWQKWNNGNGSGIDSNAYFHTTQSAPNNFELNTRKGDKVVYSIEIDGSGSGGTGSTGATYTASNGLNMAGTDVQLGGTLSKNTNIDITGGKYLGFTGDGGGNNILINAGSAALYLSRSGGLSLLAEGGLQGGQLTGSNWGGNFAATTASYANTGNFGASIGNISTDTTGDVWTAAKFYRNPAQGYPGVNILSGYGLINLYSLSTTLPNNIEDTAATTVVRWTDPNQSTKTATYTIQTATNGIVTDKFNIKATGQIGLNKYGAGAFTGILAKSLGVDASGNVIEYDASSGGSTNTASNGLIMSGSDIQLGGPSGTPAQLGHDSYITAGQYGLNFTGNMPNATLNVSNSGQFSQGTGIQGGGLTSGVTGIGNLNSTTNTNAYGVTAVNNDPTNNNIAGGIQLYRQMASSTVANGLGITIDFKLPTNSTGATSKITNSLISKLTDAADATATSQFIITGINNGLVQNLLYLSGAGILTLARGVPEYTDNTAATTAGLSVGTIYRTGDTLKVVH